MDKIEQTPSNFPSIDLAKALELYPTLEQISSDLDYILRAYRDLDRLFRRHFLSLFNESATPHPDGDKAWEALLRLKTLAESDELSSNPLNKLEMNNDRSILVCNMLSILLKG